MSTSRNLLISLSKNLLENEVSENYIRKAIYSKHNWTRLERMTYSWREIICCYLIIINFVKEVRCCFFLIHKQKKTDKYLKDWFKRRKNTPGIFQVAVLLDLVHFKSLKCTINWILRTQQHTYTWVFWTGQWCALLHPQQATLCSAHTISTVLVLTTNEPTKTVLCWECLYFSFFKLLTAPF